MTPVAIVTIVHTAAENKKARDIIRSDSGPLSLINCFKQSLRTSWGSPNISEYVFKLVFLLGRIAFTVVLVINHQNPGATPSQSLQENITKENEEHHDIIQGDFLDTYRNLSYKNIMGKLWVSQFCGQAKFVVKADDDQYVDLHEVMVLTGRYSKSVEYMSNRFLLCPVWRGLPILVKTGDDG